MVLLSGLDTADERQRDISAGIDPHVLVELGHAKHADRQQQPCGPDPVFGYALHRRQLALVVSGAGRPPMLVTTCVLPGVNGLLRRTCREQ